MAKLSAFFRRLLISLTSEDDDASSLPIPESRKGVVIILPSTPPAAPTETKFSIPPMVSQSCSASPRSSFRPMMKQMTIQNDSTDPIAHFHAASSKTNRFVNRRLSAPLIIHASTSHHARPHASAVVDARTENALMSPLQRLSLSGTTAYHNNSITSLGHSAAGLATASPRFETHSSSLNLSPSNSINLPSSLNNISPASGRSMSLSSVALSVRRAAHLRLLALQLLDSI